MPLGANSMTLMEDHDYIEGRVVVGEWVVNLCFNLFVCLDISN